MGMRRYLLVLDTDLPIGDEELHQGPVRYLAARHDQEPAEVVVLSLASSPRGSAMELLLGAGDIHSDRGSGAVPCAAARSRRQYCR